ncbi:hypothetical protein B0H14DRAFT_3524753 [Mycena olivaceomarginata]|nr:hypothetical protein B0H14DRAFT_3524753 [Mycena olivaceomarginata]
MSPSKLILVLGATGAQGQAAVDALLAPEEKSGNPSPYRVRALTRDPTSASAQAWRREVLSSFTDFEASKRYGVWVNTDGFTVGAMREIVVSLNLYPAIGSRSLSGTGARGRMEPSMQPSFIADNTLSWTVVTSTTYMDMLNGPMNIRKDGTVVFSFPIGDGRAP